MLAFGNKEFRNLQEQVLENMRQIDDIKQAAVVLDEFGIKVIGQIESADELPDPETYEGEFGDAYAVGTEAPYELYIWTRGDSLGNNAYWFNIGAFPEAGPQGPKGDTGDQGPSGTISFGTITTTTLQPSQSARVTATNVGTASNAVYNLSFEIPQGAQGIPGQTGATGATGATGPQGPKGDKGDTGTGYIIMGQLDSELDLPDPGATDRQAAYLVGANEPYDLYVIVGLPGHLEWFDSGSFTTAEADISQFDAGTGLTLDEIDGKITYEVNTNLIATHTDVAVAVNSLSSSIASVYATQASLSSFQSDVNSAFSSVYGAIDALSSVYATPADLSATLASAETYADGVKAYADNAIAELSSVYASKAEIPSLSGYATETYVTSAIGALDYASVGALSSATVIPDVTGLASVSYVDSEIARVEGEIPDVTGFATEQYVNNSVSALSSVYQPIGNYLSQSDLSGYATESWVLSKSYITSSALTGYATETYVQNELSDYAKQSELSNYTPLSQMSLYASVSALNSAISGVNSTISSLDYASVGALSANTVIPDITGLASVAYVNSAISALDYASVGALSAATVIPNVTGLASEAYVNSSIAALSSVYAPIGDYATNSALSSAISGVNSTISSLDYLSVGAMSSDTYIPRVGGDNDGTYWTSITLGDDTYDIPQGGASGDYVLIDVSETVDEGEETENIIESQIDHTTPDTINIIVERGWTNESEGQENSYTEISALEEEAHLKAEKTYFYQVENPDYDPEDIDPETGEPVEPEYLQDQTTIGTLIYAMPDTVEFQRTSWDGEAGQSVTEAVDPFALAADVTDLQNTVGDIDTILQQINGGTI